MSCGVGHRLGLDLVLWCRPAGVAPIRLLAWEPPYATGVALKSKKKKKKKKKKFISLELIGKKKFYLILSTYILWTV